MRWKPLADCYRRHETLGGILAVENARSLVRRSQTQPDETDPRPGRYLRRPEPPAPPSQGHRVSILPYLRGYSFFSLRGRVCLAS